MSYYSDPYGGYDDDDEEGWEPPCCECGTVPHQIWCSEAEPTWRVRLHRLWFWHVIHWRTPSLHQLWWAWKTWRAQRSAAKHVRVPDDDLPF